jgi:hypothetical protein
VYRTEIDNYDDTDYPHDYIYDSEYETQTIPRLMVLITMVNLIKRKQHSFQEMSGKIDTGIERSIDCQMMPRTDEYECQ